MTSSSSFQMQRQMRRPGLDLLRVVAVLAVAWFHFGFRMQVTGEAGPDINAEPGDLARYGYLGVSVFFAISGYVISLSTEGRTPFAFVVSRFARLWPVYVICMSLTASIVLLAPNLELASGLGVFAANLTMVAPFLGQPFMDGAYWSIVVEIIFYGWVALFMMAGLWRNGQVIIACVWIAVSAANLFLLEIDLLRILLITDHAAFFAFGMMLRAMERGSRGARPALCAAFLLSLGSSVVFVGRLPALYVGEAFDAWVVATTVAVSLTMLVLSCRMTVDMLPAGPIAVAGRATYPFYLLHQHIGYVVFFLLGAALGEALTALVLIAGLMLVSLLITETVERPAGRAIRHLAMRIAQRVGALKSRW